MFIFLISSISKHHFFVNTSHRDCDYFYDHVNHTDRVDYDDHIENQILGEDCSRSSCRRQRSEASEEVEH